MELNNHQLKLVGWSYGLKSGYGSKTRCCGSSLEYCVGCGELANRINRELMTVLTMWNTQYCDIDFKGVCFRLDRCGSFLTASYVGYHNDIPFLTTSNNFKFSIADKSNRLKAVVLTLKETNKQWRIAPNFQALVEGLDEELRPYVPEFSYRHHDPCTYRIALGPRAGQKVLTLPTGM